MKTEHRMCAACAEPITDKYLLQVSGRPWHAHCLRCCVCQLALDRQPSCFIRDDSVYCKADYAKSFGAKCAKCCRGISASDWVRKARDHVYHLACFACDACKRQLSTGEEFALHDDRVLCKTHYLEILDGGSTSSDECCDAESYHKNKTKRVRTTFTEEQLQVLQANFQLDSNPDGQDLERIAQITGLSKRVTQVWFQNSRARQKKHLHTGKLKSQQLHHHPAGAGAAQLARDVDAVAPFGRHINLHLTYSFQAGAAPGAGQHGPAAAAAVAAAAAAAAAAPGGALLPAGGPLLPAAAPPPPAAKPPAFAAHGPEGALDDLSQDAMGTCMRGEV